MIQPDSVPEATAPPEHHADFIELCTLRSTTRTIAVQEFIGDLRIGNASEAVADSSGGDDEEQPDDEAESIAQSAFDELDERRRNFGARSRPLRLRITNTTVELKDGGQESLYVFLALLSWYGKDAGPEASDGERIFEKVCAKAAETYFGGTTNDRVSSVVFGFPRRVLPRGFATALDELCTQLGEGGSHRKGRPKLPNQKDGKLDLVSWVEFEDRRQGKLIAFGQCATGRNWSEKISELPPPDRWCGHWMADTPTVLPIRSFFVPHRIERNDWSHSCTFGGILYDRCRIASLASDANDELRRQWVEWSAHVLSQIAGT